MSTKVSVLLCDTYPDLPKEIPSHESMFINSFSSVREGIQFTFYKSYAMELPPDFKKDELYVITGSYSAAYDQAPWILDLKDWIIKANEARVKIVGICFGHQLIAEALGGKDIKSPKGFGTGIRELNVIDDRAKRYFPSGKMKLLYHHHDQVVKLPKDAVCFLSDEFCEYAGYTIRNDIITFQGHPEFPILFIENALKYHSQNEDPEVVRKGLESLKKYTPDSKIAIQMMFDILENKY